MGNGEVADLRGTMKLRAAEHLEIYGDVGSERVAEGLRSKACPALSLTTNCTFVYVCQNSSSSSACKLYPSNAVKNKLAFEENIPRLDTREPAHSTVTGFGQPSL